MAELPHLEEKLAEVTGLAMAAQAATAPELTNASVFPGPELAARLIPERAKSEQYVRLRTRMWTRFRTGH